VVFSVGPRNRFDFPRRSVVDRYATAGVRAFRTDLDGALTVETDGHEVWATPTLPHPTALHPFLDAGE
jgi:competence protein ComEC